MQFEKKTTGGTGRSLGPKVAVTVSLREQKSFGAKRRHAAVDMALARTYGLPEVILKSVDGQMDRRPPLYTMRIDFEDVISVDGNTLLDVGVIMDPIPEETIRRVFSPERKDTRPSPTNDTWNIMSLLGETGGASYNMREAIENFVTKLVKRVGIPVKGASVVVNFAYDKRGVPSIMSVSASLTGWARKAKRRNDRAMTNYKLRCAPLPFHIDTPFGQIWPAFGGRVYAPTLHEVPDPIPEETWDVGGVYYETIELMVKTDLLMVMESLWRSAFINVESTRQQLLDWGWNVPLIGKTQFSMEDDLQALMESNPTQYPVFEDMDASEDNTDS